MGIGRQGLLPGFAALALMALGIHTTHAQAGPTTAPAAASPREPYVRLTGNTRPEANARYDRGRVADTLALEHMLLLLKRPAERQASLGRYLAQLHDRRSPNFHRWLNNAAFAQRFGVAGDESGAVVRWLQSAGFRVNAVYPNTLMIDFSGTAGDVRNAFHTEIHTLEVRGARHLANMGDPEVPAALAPWITGIVSLHDFRPHTMHRPRAQYTVSSSEQIVVPADLATIYNFGPLYAAGTSGSGQTIVIIQNSDVYGSDWTTFRSTFGLSAYAAPPLAASHPAPPSGTNNCFDPGVVSSSELEAAIDSEWASAAAPGAAIVVASCADSGTTFGGLIALENLVNGQNPPAIMSVSFGECEAGNGAAANAAYNEIYEQAVALGISVFVSAGDEGAASCDADLAVATHGIGVNGLASTSYDVAVGGTDFGDSYAGTESAYWSSTNGATYGSAVSYVPEIPWNDSCASSLIAAYLNAGPTYGSAGFCNSSLGRKDFITTASGSGGPSGCATGSPSTSGVVGGSCQGYAKPSWQALAGVPNDGVRDLPDVSLFAANGVWGHAYVVCYSDTGNKGAACSGAPSGWVLAGGTSFAAPIWAGIQALVNQSTGARQGNPNYVYYALAAGQAASTLACNSSSGNQISSGCVFNDVTLGDMDVDCQGANDCYLPSGSYGVLSTTDSSYLNAYGAAGGWDFATGIGSVNVANLVKYWNAADLTLTAKGSEMANGLLSYALQVQNTGPHAAAGVVMSTVLPAGFTLVASMSPGCAQSNQTVTCTVGSLADGGGASVSIVVQPGSGQTVNLNFTATSSNADIDPNQGMATVSLSLDGSASGAVTDGPIPAWAVLALGLLLITVALRASSPRRSPL
jgi:uncharacterized repeat protein (TIGR01451 family)